MFINIDFNTTEKRDYEIFIDELEKLEFDTKVAIVTNPTVAKFHLDHVLSIIKADAVHIISIPDGEEYKNMDTIQYILDNCFENRLDRKSILIALGGGVIGDMTGFAASIFQRGIKFIQMPTTLLSQVDASVGGKTGVNSKYGKNLIGTFWQPSRVYCETKFLDTLPKREFSAGIAEIVKMAVTFDADFFKWLEEHDLRDKENLKIAIHKSIQTKAKVVSEDEREEGVRAVLNYGHTFAHVIENETLYKTYLHGEAVAMGMVMANRLACKLGLMSENEAKRVELVLRKYDLPTTYKVKNTEEFYQHFFLDKKSHHNKITFVLAKGIGSFDLRNDIDKTLLLSVLSERHG
ncbi:MAG: 3-dehydroquinate synthase [Sulfurospirillaceae bacterium]|nr:3-dehydroquinate synthase [Sulfurospirillaceae bacterium]